MSFSYPLRLLTEAMVTGLVVAIFMSAFQMMIPLNSVEKLMFASFVVGAVIHLTFELLQINKYYCNSGAACSNRV